MKTAEFFKHIQDDFFEVKSINKAGLTDFVRKAFIAFGDVEIVDEGIDEDGDTVLRFVDNDTADMVFAPKGVNLSEVNTDMSTTLCKIYIDKDGAICGVTHNFTYFTPANKENVLMAAFLVGKKVDEYVKE